jgi:hypothetical protein
MGGSGGPEVYLMHCACIFCAAQIEGHRMAAWYACAECVVMQFNVRHLAHIGG